MLCVQRFLRCRHGILRCHQNIQRNLLVLVCGGHVLEFGFRRGQLNHRLGILVSEALYTSGRRCVVLIDGNLRIQDSRRRRCVLIVSILARFIRRCHVIELCFCCCQRHFRAGPCRSVALQSGVGHRLCGIQVLLRFLDCLYSGSVLRGRSLSNVHQVHLLL